MNVGQIIAVGGGSFALKSSIEKYILDQSSSTNPNVCFIPTASAENKAYIVQYYSIYSKLNCNPVHINLFERTPRLDSILNKQDVIFVGGGNTKSMLAVWREWKLDKLIAKAYNRGAVLCGVSAGSICWYEYGITDSWASNLNVIECLGLIKGVNCPHYSSEKDRRPSVHKFILENKITSCVASEDGAALHYKNGVLHTSVSFLKDAKSFDISMKEGKITEKEIKGIRI